MMLIGLAGAAGSGKDTVADYMVAQYGFTKFSFSDALYREVSEAFDMPVAELQSRAKKEVDSPLLRAGTCRDADFAAYMISQGGSGRWFSPRWVLQHWGTEYRRAQDPDYWIKRASLWVRAWLDVTKDDEGGPIGLVNTSVRFQNERDWVDALGGVIWHVRRPNRAGVSSGEGHMSEEALWVAPHDRVIYNTGTIEQLHTVTSLLIQSPAPLGVEFSTGDAQVPHDNPAKTIVACDTCGHPHIAYTADQIRHEVAQFNEYFDGLDDDAKEWHGGRHATAEDYAGCHRCGNTSFHRARGGELLREGPSGGEPLLPVLYGETN